MDEAFEDILVRKDAQIRSLKEELSKLCLKENSRKEAFSMVVKKNQKDLKAKDFEIEKLKAINLTIGNAEPTCTETDNADLRLMLSEAKENLKIARFEGAAIGAVLATFLFIVYSMTKGLV